MRKVLFLLVMMCLMLSGCATLKDSFSTDFPSDEELHRAWVRDMTSKGLKVYNPYIEREILDPKNIY